MTDAPLEVKSGVLSTDKAGICLPQEIYYSLLFLKLPIQYKIAKNCFH